MLAVFYESKYHVFPLGIQVMALKNKTEEQQPGEDETPQNVSQAEPNRFNNSSASYSKLHVTYFRPHSELTIINCNLYRFQFNT